MYPELDLLVQKRHYTDLYQINTLRKDSQQSNQKTKQGHILPEQSPPGHSATRYPIAESLALSSIEKDCEDAVTITAAAYMHHTSTPYQPLYRVFVPQEENGHLDGNATSHWPSISVILNIMCFDWSFASLPGSFQRIVMNLVGNSLKYTQTGYVKVDLNVRNATQDGDQEMSGSNFVAELNVTDSGKGIGAEFLRTKLYSSFSQESTLAPGTGKSHFTWPVDMSLTGFRSWIASRQKPCTIVRGNYRD